MKMMKSLILGTAVAFAATAGAQAADLPVKAKPVSYVKICPQYGPGFYYIPGTDICLRVGGLVFAEAGYYASGAITFLAIPTASQGTNDLNWRSRGYLAVDARQNTPYGTLRAYIFGGFQQLNTGAAGPYGVAGATAYGVKADAFVQFAFIQFAGFTAGLATSFFDFGPNYLGLSVASNPWNWTNLFAYTANFGNGLSATISIEDKSTTRVGNGAVFATQAVGYDAPDVVGNIRLDQAWGSAQVMAAAHQTRWTFGDEWGWAVGLGVEIKLPMIGAATAIKFSAVTSEGAVEYTGLSGSPYGGIAGIGLGFHATGTPGAIVVTDAGGALNTQTEATSYMLQLRHSWTPQLRSAFHAGYNDAYNFATFGGVQVVQYGHTLEYLPVPNLILALTVLYTDIDANNISTDKVASWFRVTRPF